MDKIIMKVLAVIGWQRGLGLVWKVAYKALKDAAQKSEAKWDDEAVEVLNELITEITA